MRTQNTSPGGPAFKNEAPSSMNYAPVTDFYPLYILSTMRRLSDSAAALIIKFRNIANHPAYHCNFLRRMCQVLYAVRGLIRLLTLSQQRIKRASKSQTASCFSAVHRIKPSPQSDLKACLKTGKMFNDELLSLRTVRKSASAA